MRRLLVLPLLALSGCGVLDDEVLAPESTPDPRLYGPAHAAAGARQAIPAPTPQPASRAVERALRSGAIGVVDVTGTVGVRPASLEPSADALLEELEWSRWDADGATGTGSLRMLECQPTCANGRVQHVPARVTLTGVTRCDGRRYFASGAVEIDPAPAGGQPATYVRAPC